MGASAGRIDACVVIRAATAVLVAALIGLVTPSAAQAQAMRVVGPWVGDCRALLSPRRGPGLRPWQAFVQVEHCDRVKRLQRLSEALPPEQRPLFFEGVVPANRLPAGFDVDMPVLRVVFPDRTFFDTARADLRPEAEAIATLVADSLRREPPDVALFVAGHADRRGERLFNEALSIDRANAIAASIFVKGISTSSIWRIGFGEDMPLVDGDTTYAHDRNRRIEFLFAARPEAVGVWLADQQQDELCQAASQDAALRCKAQLRFRPDYYDAIEVRSPARVRIDPQAIAPRPVPRPDKERRRVDPRHPGRTRVAAPIATPTRITATGGSLISLTPEGARRISIDPINKRTTVRLDL